MGSAEWAYFGSETDDVCTGCDGTTAWLGTVGRGDAAPVEIGVADTTGAGLRYAPSLKHAVLLWTRSMGDCTAADL